MPAVPHVEHHFRGSETIRDIVIGMSDGLTVPFALAAGLSGATSATAIIVTAGLAEIAAGWIAMGLGGYLAARTDAEHYANERLREVDEVRTIPRQEKEEVGDIFRAYGLADSYIEPVVEAIVADKDRWVDFMMRYELGLEAPNSGRARVSAITIALSYIVGGLVPLLPYLLIHGSVATALWVSVSVTLLALLVFGYVKGRFTGVASLRSGIQTLLIGGLAAGAAFGLARLIG